MTMTIVTTLATTSCQLSGPNHRDTSTYTLLVVAPQRRHPPTTATCSSVSVPALRGSPPAASALAGDRLYNHTLPCKRANDDDDNNKHTDKVLAFAFSCALVYLGVLPPWSALLPRHQL
uniref:(northern house mosquito) hypothetical protein n=2 Tax=Culex pipiens TaxID=7175 RepID=A0A8D8FRB8_CULPI